MKQAGENPSENTRFRMVTIRHGKAFCRLQPEFLGGFNLGSLAGVKFSFAFSHQVFG
jgi:hypothetical protein